MGVNVACFHVLGALAGRKGALGAAASPVAFLAHTASGAYAGAWYRGLAGAGRHGTCVGFWLCLTVVG